MTEHILLGLASIIVLGIAAQWLAWRLHLPSILLLLIFGIIAGPVSGVLDPDMVFGELLFPLVSVSVAIILFEGGLNLKFRELRQTGGVIMRLITIGIFVTWGLASAAAHFVAGLSLATSILLGAILVVTGPTVIIPLLRQVRPSGSLGAIVKWEGIVNDPIGAILAVLVFESILAGTTGGESTLFWDAVRALVLGGLIGLVGAGLIVLLLRRYLIPDFLQNPVALMFVVGAYYASDLVQGESGLLAVTVMGIALANQRWVSIRHILEFKENLRVLLISSLFIILAARLPVGEMSLSHVGTWAFVILLIVLVRPASVYASTFGSSLKFKERAFLAWMAPRGIVAAAVSAVFGIRLAEAGVADAALLGPITFQVIIVTVAVYGLTAGPVARYLKIAKPNPQGVLFLGAHDWARAIAQVLRDEGFSVAMIDSNWDNVRGAKKLGCRAYYGNVMSEDMLNELQLDGIGRLAALTPNEEINSLAALHFLDLFGRSEVYQLPPATVGKTTKQTVTPSHLRGRSLFDQKATFDYLSGRFASGAIVKKTPITEEFTVDDFFSMYGAEALPLFIVTESGQLRIWTADDPLSPKAGQDLISLVSPREKNGRVERKAEPKPDSPAAT